MGGNVNKSAVKKHTKKKIFCELNLFFGVERSETEKIGSAGAIRRTLVPRYSGKLPAAILPDLTCILLCCCSK